MNPLVYELTQAEADVAAARLGWRLSLGEGLLARHLAPLAAFALGVLFVAILGWTGLISRRAAEIAIILAAASYMIYRLWTRRRFLTARRAAEAWARAQRGAGLARLTLDANGFRREAGGDARTWLFADGLELDETPELVYIWPKAGEPLVWPVRDEGQEYLEAARARLGSRRAPPIVDDDD